MKDLPEPVHPANSVTFTDEILNGKLHFCAVWHISAVSSNNLVVVAKVLLKMSKLLRLIRQKSLKA